MQRALLARGHFIDVTADTTHYGRALHLLSRRSGGMHAEAAVEARERHLMHGLMRGLTEGPTWHLTWTLTIGQYGRPMSTHG